MSKSKINILLKWCRYPWTASKYVAPYTHAKSPQTYTQVDCIVLDLVREFAPDAEEVAVDSTGIGLS